MEEINDVIGMLDLVPHPAFCVKDGIICHMNQQAQMFFICKGTPVSQLLETGREEYAEFKDGRLYLTVRLGNRLCGATIGVFSDFHIFIVEYGNEQPELRAMALAARELRQPLSSLINNADCLFPNINKEQENIQDQLALINRSIFQMQRLVLNMSDAARYLYENAPASEVRNITAVLDELFQRAKVVISNTGVNFHYTNLSGPLYCLLDEEKLERAFYNILSNALKFTSKGGSIEVRVMRRSQKLYLTVQDNGSGVAGNIRNNVFTRYLRKPSLEDGQLGIGLGLVMVRAAAAAHSGTVLMESPKDGGNRITMTLSLRESNAAQVKSPTLRIDYAGERDHALLELSDVLPSELYEPEIVN